ncbi:MAG: TonB-dependent receptor [Burkholderiaceae bacterium]|jgi:iron complex outermembrane receptor protein|nr:TonB-dependent receptor [Burkholderiaceae bacterium]
MQASIAHPTAVGRWLATALILWVMGAPARAGEAVPDLPLEELLKTEVTTASRKSQALYDVPAAAFVLSADDIQRSGATNLPEALRLVPGVEVARLGSGAYAVSVRGANGRFANKLLVLIDGRSVYSPLFSGVFWEAEGVLPEDIDRIEVIRGPGAAMWGANAVNGVINVITRRAQQTQEAMVSARSGLDDAAGGAVRYGFALGETWRGRLAAKAGTDASVATVDDGTRMRYEWQRLSARADQLDGDVRRSVIFNATRAEAGERWSTPLLTPPYRAQADVPLQIDTADLMYRDARLLDGGSELAVQASAATMDAALNVVTAKTTQADLDVQYRMPLAEGRELVVGTAARAYRDRVIGAMPITFSTEEVSARRWSAYGQLDWPLVRDRLRLSTGVRIDRETGGSPQWQPNLKLLWLPSIGHTLWASAARASRLMSRGELDAGITQTVLPPQGGNPLPLEIRVSPPTGTLAPERLTAFELGYRGEVTPVLFVDATLFSHRLRDAAGVLAMAPAFDPGPPPRAVQPLVTANVASVDVHGIELFADWRPARGWRTQAGGSFQDVSQRTRGLPGSTNYAGNAPGWQLFARIGVDPRPGSTIDLIAKRVAALEAGNVPAYTRVDLRLAQRLSAALEIALVGQNLTDAAHPEMLPEQLPALPVQIRRGGYLKLTARF